MARPQVSAGTNLMQVEEKKLMRVLYYDWTDQNWKDTNQPAY